MEEVERVKVSDENCATVAYVGQSLLRLIEANEEIGISNELASFVPSTKSVNEKMEAVLGPNWKTGTLSLGIPTLN
jgi:hypothetical protein